MEFVERIREPLIYLAQRLEAFAKEWIGEHPDFEEVTVIMRFDQKEATSRIDRKSITHYISYPEYVKELTYIKLIMRLDVNTYFTKKEGEPRYDVYMGVAIGDSDRCCGGNMLLGERLDAIWPELAKKEMYSYYSDWIKGCKDRLED